MPGPVPGTVAITGATGFVGRRLVRALAADGRRVRVLARRPGAADFEGVPVEVVAGDLDDRAALARLIDGAGAIVHAAGLVAARSRAAFLAVNADAARRLADLAAGRPRPPRLVHVSSLAARRPELSAYALSKRAGEEAVIAAGDKGLPWTVVRPPAVYGPGDRATLPLFRCAARGFWPVLGPADARLSLIHVDDLAGVLIAAADRDAALGRVLEPDDATPGGHGWDALARAASLALGRRVRPLRVPGPLVHALGAVGGLLGRLGTAPMLTPGKARELRHRDWVCDAASLPAGLARAPAFPPDRGFADAAAWYRSHGWL